MEGLMQKWPLVVNNILDYAAKFHGEQELVSRTVEGSFARCTYRDLQRRSKLCSLALKSLGVRAGDVVATMAWNSTRHMECWYGVMGIGAVCHTLNPRLFEQDLEYIINHAGDVVIMADAMFVPLLESLSGRIPNVRHFVILSDEKYMPKRSTLRDITCYEDLLEDQFGDLAGFKWEVADENMAAGLCYTSGTTGNPKGVMYSHRSNYLHALMLLVNDATGLSSDTSVLMVVPMFHANAWGLVFQGPMVGAKLVLPGPHLDGVSVYRLLEEERIFMTAAVPTVLLGLLDHLSAHHLPLHHLKLIVVGGAACPRSMMEAYEDKYGVEVRHMWGMTELSPVGTLGRLKGTLPKMTLSAQRDVKMKQGRPHLFCDMRVVDDEDKEQPWDGKSLGTIQVRGPIVLAQYVKADKKAVDDDGWFDTGDVGTMDQYGHMHITDRAKDVIKSGGEWISSIEIENLAVGHPQISQAAVIGIPHPKWTERPLLIVVPADNNAPPSKSEVMQYLAGNLAKWWLPDDVIFVEEIPLTATGKISKLTLRKKYSNHITQASKL